MKIEPSGPVDAYTDGSSIPNPGPGGWCVLLVVPGRVRTFSGSEAHTTNNRMELRAAIEVFKRLAQPCCIRVHTDSEYLRLGITRWVDPWRRRGWRTKSGGPVSNQDLWQELLAAMGPHQVEWDWVQAHAGNSWNERADRCARRQAGRASSRLARVPALEEEAAWDLYVWGSAQPSRSEWGYLLQQGSRVLRGHGESSRASSNQLVLRAAIEGLRRSPSGDVVILHTNSEYLSKGIDRCRGAWPQRGWKTSSGRPVQNLDLWRELLPLLPQRSLQIGAGGPPEDFKRTVRGGAAARKSPEKT